MVMQFVQVAAGADHELDAEERATVHAIAERVSALTGLEPGSLDEIPDPGSEAMTRHALAALAANLESRAARELAYALAFLVSVADLELKPVEKAELDEVQRALGLDDPRAIDLIVTLTKIVGASG